MESLGSLENPAPVLRGASREKTHPWELAWRSGRWTGGKPPLPAVMEFSGYLARNGIERVLDLGAGNGRHTMPLAEKGFQLVALDVSESALRILERRTREAGFSNVTLVKHEMSELPFVDGYFDGVVCTNVLHHGLWKEVTLAFEEVGRVLRKGAAGLFVVVSDKDYRFGTGKKLEPMTFVFTEGEEKGIVHHFFSKEELRAVLSGFRIVRLWEEFSPENGQRRAHLYVVVRKK